MLKKIWALRESPRWVAAAAILGLIIYSVWMAWPYLRSVVARDAAVTSWITIAHAPIDGSVSDPLVAGSIVGPDGRIATITDDRVDPLALGQAIANRDRARAQRDGIAAQVDILEAIYDARQSAADAFADAFRRNIEDEIKATRARIASVEQALSHERAEAERQERLVALGSTSQTEADLARVRVIDRERQLDDLRTVLAHTERHLAAFESGAFLLPDESDGGNAQGALDEAEVILERARTDLGAAEAALSAEEAIVAALQTRFDRTATADVVAPADAIVWNQYAGPLAHVPAGAAIAAWIDCRVLLVDVPISDLEASLLRPGMPADVAVEGEDDWRSATLLFTRGAAATLTADDLAAVAKGRHPGVAQAILKLDAIESDAESCPVGRAAFVDFPGVGTLDLVRARIGL